jgi:ferric-dicitrate binding protein FerR (iron transport regulator)
VRAWLALPLRLTLLLIAGCVVTRVPAAPERPFWHITDGAQYDAGCLTARAYVRKSGREGMGVAVQLRSRGDCAVAITGGQLELGAQRVPVSAPAGEPLAMRGRSQLYAWLPIHFDGAAAWNDDSVHAQLVLSVTVNGTPAPPWRLALLDAMEIVPP